MNIIAEKAPVALFVYNRLKHTKQTVEALKNNKFANETPLYVFSDAAKDERQIENVKKVREYIRTITGFASLKIIEQEQNIGISNSIIKGVSQAINEYGKVIVVEDDIVTSPYFLQYMNTTLDKYEEDPRIFSVAGFNYPHYLIKFPEDYKFSVYFTLRPSSWGWGIWKDRWDLVDWDVKDYSFFKTSQYLQKYFNAGGSDLTLMLVDQMENDIDAWDIRFCYNQMILHRLSVYPVQSYVNNVGLDGTGVHCGSENIYFNELGFEEKTIIFPDKIKLDLHLLEQFRLLHGGEGGIKYHFYALFNAIKLRLIKEINKIKNLGRKAV